MLLPWAVVRSQPLFGSVPVKVEAQNDIPEDFRNDPDAKINTTEWKYLVHPHQWIGYDKPEYIWQPVGQIKKFNIVPLFIGSETLALRVCQEAFDLGLFVTPAIYPAVPPGHEEVVWEGGASPRLLARS